MTWAVGMMTLISFSLVWLLIVYAIRKVGAEGLILLIGFAILTYFIIWLVPNSLGQWILE